MDYRVAEERIRADYRQIAGRYRRDDELEVTTENHQRLARKLKQLCLSFPDPLSVLDAGCGTGRHFHCLEKVDHLVGLDLSGEMLAAARDPVRRERITAAKVELIEANIFLAFFLPASFDLIYSLGMFGHACPVTPELCAKFYSWLRPGGKLFFNVVDVAGLPFWFRTRRRLRQTVYPVLPHRLQCRLRERENRSPFFALTRAQLQETMAATRFSEIRISSRLCNSPLWPGRHLECLAIKPGAQDQEPAKAGDQVTAGPP